jgi:hypothetical protein
MTTLQGTINPGVRHYSGDVTINDLTFNNQNTFSYTNVPAALDLTNDPLTIFPPRTHINNPFTSTQSYGFLEIRTNGVIYVNGHIDLSGKGYIGGNGGGGDADVYGNNGRGGYLTEQFNGDPLHEKSFSQVLNIDPFYNQEKNRNCVFPGSGGKGGGHGGGDASGGGGGGGCGGGVIRLIADGGIIFGPNGKITTTGKRDGGNGGSGGFSYGNASCKSNNCTGTIVTCDAANPSASFSSGGNGGAGRSIGSGSGGSKAGCCSINWATRCWSDCDCGYWANDSVCDGTTCGGGGCCCKNQTSGTKNSTGCNNGGTGNGGAGGGVLLRSYGPIQFNQDQIDLRGYVNRDHGGTLKLFHSNLVPDWIFDINDRNKMSSILATRVGGFYNEIIYSGYCPTINGESTTRVSSLTSVATNFNPGEEVFNFSFEEGDAFVPHGLQASMMGFEIYRAIDVNGTFNNGNEIPPPDDDISWFLVTTVDYVQPNMIIGPTNMTQQPLHNEVRTDSLGRRWVYSDGSDDRTPAWYLNVSHARSINQYPRYSYDDSTIMNYLTLVLGKTNTEAINILQQILYAEKQIWYKVKPKFNVGGNELYPDCEIEKVSIHPEVTYPLMDVVITPESSTPYEFSSPNIADRIFNSNLSRYDTYYDDKKIRIGNNVRGYDDLTVLMNSPTYWGSFRMLSWNIAWDHAINPNNIFVSTVGSVSANTPRRSPTSVNFTNVYDTPTKHGRLSYTPTSNDPLGYKVVQLTAFFNQNCYDSTAISNFTNNSRAEILEREPTPVFYLSALDYVGSTRGGISWPAGDNNIFKYFTNTIDENSFYFRRVVSGYADSVDVKFYDSSIARTYPIGQWMINYDEDGNSNFYTLNTTNNADAQRNEIGGFISDNRYEKAGVYYPTLIVKAQTSNTSHDLSAINRVYVNVLPPTALFTHQFSTQQVSGFVPIKFTAKDLSIANSNYPITAWTWDVYDSFDRTHIDTSYSFYTANATLQHDWKWHTENYEEDNITVDPSIKNLCLNVLTSAYGWRGRTDSSGFTNLRFEGDQPVFGLGKLCKDVYLYEKPPVAGIQIFDAVTLTSTFTDDDPDYEEYPAYATSNYVSGYSPYLKVEFKETSVPKSYPISGYFWNFDDYYNEETNKINITLPTSAGSTGWEYPFPVNHGLNDDENYPRWYTDETNHYVEHVFTLPGLYLITLNVAASTTSTTRSTQVTAEVFETPPTCGFVVSLDKQNWTEIEELSGYAPLTVYFNPSGVKAGSFPIGKLIWDFGDGTKPLVIDRYIDNYNNQSFGSDPRGYNGGVIEHTFERQFVTSPSSFNVSLSVVSDFSNYVVACPSREIGPIFLPPLSGVHLIKNRSLEVKKDNLYVFQKESDKSIYNITLSSN